MTAVILLWSHLLAAVLFGALAVWQLRHWNGDPRNRPLVAAFAVTSLWAIFLALQGPGSLLSGLAESARNFAFLAFMYGIVRSAGGEDHRQRALKLVYATVAGVIGLQLVIAGVLPRFAAEPTVQEALESTSYALGLTIAAGSLVLVHNLYGQAAPDSRWGIRLPAIALAGMWVYDIHLYTTAYLIEASAPELFAMRGAVMAMIAPLFWAASRRNAQWKVRMSRAATFQSLSVIAILGYLVVMMTATRTMAIVGGDWARIGQIALISVMTLAALVFLPSGRARSRLQVVLAKHLFEHRYDYRQEWLGFTRTIGRAGADAEPLAERVVKALADMADAPAGLLLLADDQQRLHPGCRWNWEHPVGQTGADDVDMVRYLETSAHVIAFDGLVDGALQANGRPIPLPGWLRAEGAAWAGIPLVHHGSLVGLVILAHPRVPRPLDWEDFDLFRTAGIQAASYLAEARSQEALADVRRFDEFNRRFAFILHDIKNLVSQLSLVARNAERHADNPEFRADMVATLQSSVKKMNDLLARLSPNGGREPEPLRPTPLWPILAGIAWAKRSQHSVELSGDPDATAMADAARLEQAIGHIVQNAIDATPGGEPVHVGVREAGGHVTITIEDKGDGMSAEFVRTRLFQPFASTKEGGFGIGAHEARAIVLGLDGRLEVESREGEGSRFTIILKDAAAAASADRRERRRA